jgi:glycosyltransferase involved in cell wall biosynthesis
MNILFLTLARIEDVEQSGIYQDLLRKFRDNGHHVTIVCPIERRYNQPTQLVYLNEVSILKVWSTNFQKTNIIEKGITTLIIENIFFFAIKKHIDYKKFDLILYSTPPITFTNLIKRIKKVSQAKTYLLLKDIFPQNAVDLKLMNNNGILFKYFRSKEKVLYKISDHIGCMSPENMNYVLKHNSEIDAKKVEINPNSIEIKKRYTLKLEKEKVLEKYGLPKDKVLFIFGGNLGLPQGIEYLKRNIQYCKPIANSFFIIVGNGTEYHELKEWFEHENISNACLISELPKSEFDQLLNIVDVGLIFLNPLFTIPNFPSRLLSYLENKIPVICATDTSTDIGKIAVINKFGFSCLTSDSETFFDHIIKLLNIELRSIMGENGYKFLLEEYTSDISYTKIIQKLYKN